MVVGLYPNHIVSYTSSAVPNILFFFSWQLEFLDNIDEGVEVTRQALGSGQYRWTVTFLDEGDDFELEDVVSRNFLNDSSTSTPEVTATKVKERLRLLLLLV